MIFVINNLRDSSCIYLTKIEMGFHHTRQRTQYRRCHRELRDMDGQLYQDRPVGSSIKARADERESIWISQGHILPVGPIMALCVRRSVQRSESRGRR